MTASQITTSVCLQTLQELAPSVDDRIKRVRESLASCSALEDGQLPPKSMMNLAGSPDAVHYRNTMADHFTALVLRGAIEPDHTVLDLGCGCGRLALPFAHYLDGGTYIGIDVSSEALSWCRKNLDARGGTMRFIQRETVNKYSFESRNPVSRNSYHLAELQHEQVDFAFAISLFTKLQQRDCLSYLSELARVIRRNGCAYLTTFIIDDFFFDFVRRSGRHRAVTQEESGCYYAFEGLDFFAGYTRRTWTRMIEDSGLRIVGYDPGRWAEKPGALHHEDTFTVIPQGYRKD